MARRAARTPGALAIVIAIAVALIAAGALAPAGALADGDPASDVLLGENVFYPYEPAVSEKIAEGLDAVTAAAAKAGFPLKVALIASPIDLGTIPELFGKPQEYANYLDVEISFEHTQPVLVVMSDGYGLQGATEAAARAIPSLRLPAGRTSDDLALAATTAVARLAAATGHPIAGERLPIVPAVSGDGGPDLGLLVIMVLGALALAGGLLALRSRPRPTGGRRATRPAKPAAATKSGPRIGPRRRK